MATTYSTSNLGTSRNRVRLMIPDTDVSGNHIFEDEEIDAFLAITGSDIRLATATALEAIATSEALKLKVLSVGDLETDGAKLSDALMARAKQLRADAAAGNPADSTALPFAIAEQAHGIFGLVEVLENERARSLV